MNWIDNVEQFSKLWSVRLGTIAVVLGGVAVTLPMYPDYIVALLPHWFQSLCAVCAVLTGASALGARAVKQPKLAECPPKDPPAP